MGCAYSTTSTDLIPATVVTEGAVEVGPTEEVSTPPHPTIPPPTLVVVSEQDAKKGPADAVRIGPPAGTDHIVDADQLVTTLLAQARRELTMMSPKSRRASRVVVGGIRCGEVPVTGMEHMVTSNPPHVVRWVYGWNTHEHHRM